MLPASKRTMKIFEGTLVLFCLYFSAKTIVQGHFFRYAFIWNYNLSITDIRECKILKNMIHSSFDVADFEEFDSPIGLYCNLTSTYALFKILKKEIIAVTPQHQIKGCGLTSACGENNTQMFISNMSAKGDKDMVQRCKNDRPKLFPQPDPNATLNINIEWSLATPIKTQIRLISGNRTEFECKLRFNSREQFINCTKLHSSSEVEKVIQKYKGFEEEEFAIGEWDETARIGIQGYFFFKSYYKIYFMDIQRWWIYTFGSWKPKKVYVKSQACLFNISFPQMKKKKKKKKWWKKK